MGEVQTTAGAPSQLSNSDVTGMKSNDELRMEYQDSRLQMDLVQMEERLDNFHARHKGVIDGQIELASHCEEPKRCSECERCLENKIYQQLRQLKDDMTVRLNVLRSNATRAR